MYSKEYDFFSCAYHPYVYATGGDIWNPETRGDVVGVLNTDANAQGMEKLVPSCSTCRGAGTPTSASAT